MASRWDRRASKLAAAAGEGTVLAGCRADPPAADSLEGGLRSVAGSLGARLGARIDDALGRGDSPDQPVAEQTAVDSLPAQGHVALVVGGRLVLFDAAADGPAAVVARWPVSDIVLVSADDVSSLTLNVTRIGVVFGDGTSLTFDAPRQGFGRDIDRFVKLLREAAGAITPGD